MAQRKGEQSEEWRWRSQGERWLLQPLVVLGAPTQIHDVSTYTVRV
jgi:hypothetical protein